MTFSAQLQLLSLDIPHCYPDILLQNKLIERWKSLNEVIQ